MSIQQKVEKRFAVLQASKDSDHAKKVYGGYFNVFLGTLAEEGEVWDLYMVVDGEFPEMHELHKYEGFVISGSAHDAYGNESWIINLRFLVQTLHLMHKKILGICFGHQVICHALGGKVGKAYTGWDLGIREVKIEKDFFPCGWMDGLDEVQCNLHIIECHQDEVWEVPNGAKVIASSDKTKVEMLVMDEHILGIQGHPEYSNEILNSIIDRLLAKGCIEEGFCEDVKSQLFVQEPDRKSWGKICRKFLKSQISVETNNIGEEKEIIAEQVLCT